MTEHVLDLSARFIDSGRADGPPNRVSHELSELTDGVALVEAFSHVVTVRTDDGLVAFDSSGPGSGSGFLSLRRWNADPIHTLIYTHGHIDHVGGSSAVAEEARQKSRPLPQVVGHANLPLRMDRYRATNGYNKVIMLDSSADCRFPALKGKPVIGLSYPTALWTSNGVRADDVVRGWWRRLRTSPCKR